MKRINLLFILWMFTFPLFAQTAVSVSGTVTDITSGVPVVNHEVIIQTDSAYGSYYYHVVYTNPNGFYTDFIPMNQAGSTGLVHISTYDCQQYLHSFSQTYSPSNTTLVQNFVICSFPPDCHADYLFAPAGPMTMQFTDISVGQNALRTWDFGDSTGSNLLNPIHTFQYPGFHAVTLTIGAQGTTCWDQETKSIFVGDTIPTGCQAYFNTEPDPATPFMVHFINQSIGNLSTFTWNFGDGTATTVTFPGNPNVTHQYIMPGSYTACLTVQGFDSLCTSTFCRLVVVDSIYNQCHANYAFQPTGPLTMQFTDQSVGSNALRTWDFGDGTTSTQLNPVHVFPATGYYIVNLTIGTPGTACWDQEIKTIWVSDTTAYTCQAYFHTEQNPSIPFQVNFVNLSIGNLSTFIWDFGDGSGSAITFPGNPNVTHNYNEPGAYNVCLTVHGFDSICSSTYCSVVLVDSIYSQCHAAFTYGSSINNQFEIHFTDLSTTSQTTIVAWNWFFDDPASGTNNSSSLQNPTHTYSFPGSYNVCLTIYASSGCSNTYCFPIVVGQNQGCQAYYTYAPYPPASIPNVIQFTDASLSAGTISWFWNFDDGTTSTEQNPVHTFPVGPVIDPYFVCLTITSIDSCYDTYCTPIIPQNPGCVAAFDIFPRPTPNTKRFEDRSTGNIQSWTWEFGDGTTQVINAPNNPNVTHTFPAPGYYNVCLFIHGSDSCSSHKCETIAVGDSVTGCHAQFSFYPDSTNAGNTIHFVNLSTGNPAQWLWDFGDPASGVNNTSTSQNPVHTYTALGTYNVCLTISGQGCQDVWCGVVEVGAPVGCASYFTYNKIGLSVHYEGHLLSGNSGMFMWNFGDNQFGVGENIVHNYTYPGIYYVTLTTTTNTPAGCTFTSGQMVQVGDNTSWHQVYGQVFAGNFPAGPGMVLLFSMDSSSYFVPFVAISPIDSSGVYYFPMVPEGNFVIYAIPFNPGFMPTYYGDVLNWQAATVITLGTPNNPYNIHLVEGDSFATGIGIIHGQVTQGDISSSMLDKVSMLLKDENGKTIKHVMVDAAGNFEFNELAYGTYYLYAELAGCQSQNIQVVLSETKVNAEVNLILSGRSILGIGDAELAIETAVLYPNPVTNDARISIRLNKSAELTIELYTMTGQLIYRGQESAGNGETVLTIPANHLSNGVYTLKIFTRDGQILTRKLVKSN